MPHAKRSSAGKMHGGRPRNSLRSNSLGRLSAVCIRPALNRMAHVSLATCPTRACRTRCHANFYFKQHLEKHALQGELNSVRITESPAGGTAVSDRRSPDAI